MSAAQAGSGRSLRLPQGRATRALALACAALLAGCASLPPDGGLAEVERLSREPVQRVTGVNISSGAPAGQALADAQAQRVIDELLAQPLTADAAVRIALLNNPGMQAALAGLALTQAELVQAAQWPNPHFGIGRMREGDTVEIERMLSFNVLGLVTLPWRAQWAQQQSAVARMQAAQDVVRLAAQARQAWVRAVAAQQTAAYMRDVKVAAEAGAELARRMARVGNWSALNQAREQSFLAEATTQLARAEHDAFARREELIRVLGLWGPRTQFRLSERLPELPASLADMGDIEARALRERLDVQAAQARSAWVASTLGLTRVTGFVDGLSLGYQRSTSFDNAAGSKEIKRGFELELPLPIFDWGQARNAAARARYMESAAQVRDVAVQARSQAREAWHAWRTSHDIARHHRDELVPLRRFIHDETVLRYNGMFASVFELLADARANVLAVNASIDALRDFWLADTDLRLALSGGAPQGVALGKPASAPGAGAPAGH